MQCVLLTMIKTFVVTASYQKEKSVSFMLGCSLVQMICLQPHFNRLNKHMCVGLNCTKTYSVFCMVYLIRMWFAALVNFPMQKL